MGLAARESDRTITRLSSEESVGLANCERLEAWGGVIRDSVNALLAMPNHSLERARPRRRDNVNGSWPGRSARGRYAEFGRGLNRKL